MSTYFRTGHLVDKGDNYLIEGDIMLSKKEMKEYVHEPDSTKLKQSYVGGRLISLIKAQNITVRVDSSIPQSGIGSDWRQAIIRAIDEWNNIKGTCLNFSYTTNSKADITVKRIASSDDAIAWTWLPSGQNPAKEIFVNSNSDNYQFKANTLIHEIGHSIGLLHAHQSANSQGGIVIPGTQDIDSTSIMSYYRNRTILPGFSNQDLIAIRRLYPGNLPYLKVEKKISGFPMQAYYEVTLENYEAGGFSPKVTWSVVGSKSPLPNSLILQVPSNSLNVVPAKILGVIACNVVAYQDKRVLCAVEIRN